jgi:hypothetical protein
VVLLQENYLDNKKGGHNFVSFYLTFYENFYYNNIRLKGSIKMNNSEDRIKTERIQKELNDRIESRKRRRDEVKNAKYESRRLRKALFSIAPVSLLTVGSVVLSACNILPISLVPAISVGGGLFIGDVAEYIYFNKHSSEDVQDIADNTRERREMYLNVDIEDAKCEAYIHEYEYNHVISNENKAKADSKHNSNRRFEEQEKNFKENLKQLNKKIVLTRNYPNYGSKGYAYLIATLKTLVWTLELVLLYELIKLGVGGSIGLYDLLIPTGVGSVIYGAHNLSITNERLKFYNKYKKAIYDPTGMCDLDSLRKKQNELIKEIGNIKIIEKYNKSVTEAEENRIKAKAKESHIYYHNAYDNIPDYNVSEDKPKVLGLKK